jgi:hypothetical protein
MAKAKIQEKPRIEDWTVFTRHWISGETIIIKAPGEFKPMGFGSERPATRAEVKIEQKRRAESAVEQARRTAFRARPEWQDANMIRSTIEIMDHENHPLDCMTPDEWRTLRIKICGAD